MTEPIDHSGYEVVDAPEPPAHTHRHVAAPTAFDVILEGVAMALPCPECGSTAPCRCIKPADYSPARHRAGVIHEGLMLYGYLPKGDEGEPAFDPEETAQWLADRSGFARYTQPDGWKKLIESPRDVELAAIRATPLVAASEVDMVKAARAALLAWHQHRQV